MTVDRISFTPVPQIVIDDIMPTLRDTENRVLFVVIRQTNGWRGDGPGRTKEADWLSHSQLRKRTGRASEAVSAAIDVLVRRDLIEVTDASGRALVTPEDRRACRGKLYYRVGRALPQPVGTRRARNTGKPKTTIDSDNGMYCPFRKTEEGRATGSWVALLSGPTPDVYGQERIEREKAAIRERLSRLRV